MSTFPEPVFSSMCREVTEVGAQAVLFAVGLAAVDTVDHFLTAVLEWPLLVVAIFKICSMYKSPQKSARRVWNGSPHEYPIPQALMDIILWVAIYIISTGLSRIEINLTEDELLKYGKMIHAGVSFGHFLYTLIISRGCFLMVDHWFGGGLLSSFIRTLVIRDVEGLSEGSTHINLHQN